MKSLPHTYTSCATASDTSSLQVTTPHAPELACSAPAEFGGPGDQWSPESLLVAAAASCVVLTFRALARAAKLNWLSLECSSKGTLERDSGVLQFTRLVTHARLVVPADANRETCRQLLEKAERDCLIGNSLRAPRQLTAEISTR